MLSEAEGAPIGRTLTNEDQKGLLETAASNPAWEHVYCAAVLDGNKRPAFLYSGSACCRRRPDGVKGAPPVRYLLFSLHPTGMGLTLL